MDLTWIKCKGDVWCSFENVNVDQISSDGVYIIWHGGDNARVVYVGQGDVAARITDHREDDQILYYSQFGLYVTWADVASAHRDGVERYLAGRYPPLVGEAFPDVIPIEVNAPW